MILNILPDNFSDRFAETEKKRLAKPFYSKTILQIVSVSELIKSACYDFLSGSVDFKMKKIYLTA